MREIYRRRMITVALLSFLILLVLVITGVFLFSYLQMESETDRTIESLLNFSGNDDRFFEGVRPGGFGIFPGKPSFPSAFYDITAKKDGTVISSEFRGFPDDAEGDVQSIVKEVLVASKSKGRLESFKYGIQEAGEDNLHIILLDISIQLQMLISMLRNALIIGMLLLTLLFIILLPISARASALLIQNAERQKQFITDAGHELKTPVAVIRSNLDVMELLQGKSNWSGNIRTQVDRLEGLVKQLLLLARLDEKQWSGKMTVFDFSRELNNEVAIYEETVSQKELTLQKDIVDGLRVRGEEESLRQLIHVLLDNAMQYTQPNGRVWINAAREKKSLHLEITNTVDALPQIEPERLLDRFTRGDTARSRKNGGTGIGLSTAKRVAELNQGEIKVSYINGNLFQVVVTLPLANA